ncbi:MAG: ABC transporter permease [Actinomycetota bacterium]
MKAARVVRQSLGAIFANKARSFLTVLGIVIGIASVIALMSLGNGAKKDLTESVSILGTTNITVTPGVSSGTGPLGSHGGQGQGITGGREMSTLTQGDLDALAAMTGSSGISAVSGNIAATSIFETQQGERRFQVTGTSQHYPGIMNLEVAEGGWYTEQDVESGAAVIVLGSDLAGAVSGGETPMGKSLQVGGDQYTVIGVLGVAEENGITNPNEGAFIPYTAARTSFDTEYFSSIVIQAQDEGSVDAVKEEATGVLLSNHGIEDEELADFTVRSSQDLLATISSITDIMTAFLAGIAAISLLVGGIGIMNIMLVSVTERTREIGLRKAVGARTIDILVQFIAEAVMLTFAGGILGILFGQVLSVAAGHMLEFSTVVTGGSVLLAVFVAAVIGIVFGIYPAAKAARLDPIEALRYE